MKKAEDYVREMRPDNKRGLFCTASVLSMIKQAQIDTIDAAVKRCAENAKLLEKSNWGRFEDADKDKNPIVMEHTKIKKNNFGHGDCTYQIITVSEQSILQVADKLKIEL